MNSTNTVIEYKEDLIFAACELRWSHGDKFALIEAIAICAARNLPYPDWVRDQINAAMSILFGAVFPDANLEEDRPGLGISSLPDGRQLSDMNKRFQAGTKEAAKLLSLKLDRRNIPAAHIKAVRDYYLAELVANLAKFKVDPSPHFSGVTEVKKTLGAALRLTLEEWNAIERDNGNLGQINGETLHIRDVPAVCRMATFDNIDDAWDTYKEKLLADRVFAFELDHGVNLTE